MKCLRKRAFTRQRRFCQGDVTLGGVTCTVKKPLNPQLVPINSYLPDNKDVLQSLRWMMQKHNLGQDIFLMGTPGPRRRWLALKFCHALMKEVEYLSLSRDTTEADIKQRREMQNGDLVFVDQPAVKAAIHGRVLILDGVERVERNVLPVINNLLENREMALEDGRFLTSPDRYDELLQTHTEEELTKIGLVKVSREFRVIALGLPVPRYAGTPLDPPLRSRFQCLGTNILSIDNLYKSVQAAVPSLPKSKLDTIVGFLVGLAAAEQEGTDQDQPQHFPDLLEEDLLLWAAISDVFPDDPLGATLKRVFPYDIMCDYKQANSREFIISALRRYQLLDSHFDKNIGLALPSGEGEGNNYTVTDIKKEDAHATITFESISTKAKVVESCGCGNDPIEEWGIQTMKLTPTYSSVLTDMMKDHVMGKHICLVGPPGCGKSQLAKQFSQLLGYSNGASTVHCHWDMSAKEMLQRRNTLDNGDTIWELTAIARAAINGQLLVLDGVDKLQPGVLASLGRLFIDGEGTLYDGTVLRSTADYNKLLESGLSRDQLTEMGVYEVHPAFRIIALAHPANTHQHSSTDASGRSWIEGEVQQFFNFHKLCLPPVSEIEEIIKSVAPEAMSSVPSLLMLQAQLAAAEKNDNSIPILSLRQILRIARSPSLKVNDLHSAVTDTLLVDIMPQFAAEKVIDILSTIGINKSTSSSSSASLQLTKDSDKATIGDVSVPILPIANIEDKALVPHVTFHTNEEHLQVIRKLFLDFSGDDDILLIGKQGVGKNRLIDKTLELMDRPRQYVQLHRDSTVASLTVKPEVTEGKIHWEDAPLVKAVKNGHILVVDEIDKAPLEVVGVLKGLIEDKQLILSDGRRISNRHKQDADTIPIHPNFRMIALANVPGFPFLGNDFFAACGDLFRCHLIDNPDRSSVLEVLQKYGPSVPKFALNSMADCFQQLDKLVSDGLLAYPYSLRELVAIVKHLEKYPQDGLVTALQNVFEFDNFEPSTKELILNVFAAGGIPLTGSIQAVHKYGLTQPISLPKAKQIGKLLHQDIVTQNIFEVVPIGGLVQRRLWEWHESKPAVDTFIIDGRMNGVFDERLYTIHVPPASNPTANMVVRSLAATVNGNIHAVVSDLSQKPVSLQLNTYRGSDLYVSQKSRPNQLDHSTCKILELSSLVQGLEGSIEVHSLGISEHNVVLFCSSSPTSKPKVFIVNTNDKVAAKLLPPILQDSDESNSDNKQTSWFQSVLGGSENECFYNLSKQSLQHGIIVIYTPHGLNISIPYDSEGNQLTHFKHGASSSPEESGHWVSVAPVSADEEFAEVHATSPTEVIVLMNTGKIYTLSLLAKYGYELVLETEEATSIDFSKSIPKTITSTHFIPRNHLSGTYKEVNGVRPLLVNDIPSAVGSVFSDNETQLMLKNTPSSQVRSTTDGTIVVADTKTEQVLHFNTINDVYFSKSEKPKPFPMWNDSMRFCDVGNGCLAVLTPSKQQIAIIDLNIDRLNTEWSKWGSIMGHKPQGTKEDEELSLQYSDSKIQPSELKHGKEDPDNTPHVGGNTWAGGTGGTDTAGLGGKVGPYRIDAGHPVHQVSDEAKASVPEHLKEQARKMGKEALKKRLDEIHMTSSESTMYNRAHEAVRKEVAMVQTMLKGLQSKEGERVWLKNQTDGVWDEGKLVEGMTGEKAVFKKRGESVDQPSPLAGKKKRIVFCMDCSASMFRFNSVDHRLDRSVEAAIMITESFKGTDDRIEYSMIGHSGDSPSIPLVEFGQPPQNKKERLETVLSMVAHTQYCWSGDNTLQSMRSAIKKVMEKDGDQHFVFVISDANLRRYGITTHEISSIIRSDPRVNVFCIFIASFGREAEQIKKNLPAGHGHVCYDSKDLPSVLKKIFLATNLLK
eukprot:TRINITY_DN3129_c0_g2_i1.p1 TRINITY_DN3129_c0_g2~~TRINITY_DN3129_c0_g2_i1.p1  ORF type:complete len:1879 (+),score=356.83 TRINITY_DN3129_c0_g2_i1:191-5827(+)